VNVKQCIYLLVLSLTQLACATTQIDLPSLTTSGQGGNLPGKVIWHDLLSDTPGETRVFYSQLFGWEFTSLDSMGGNYEIISHGGKAIGGMVDQTRLPTTADISQWVVILAVDDVVTATEAVVAAGGKVFTPPTSLGTRGEIAVVADPQGAIVALLQTDGDDPTDTEAGLANGDFLWNELWTGNVDTASQFYQKIAPYTLEKLTFDAAGSHVPYRVLSSQGRARAGIRSNPVPGSSPRWQSYLRVESLGAMEAILSRVPELGGSVLMTATQRPEGGHVSVIEGPSGAVIALQTWPLGPAHDTMAAKGGR
jgi:predicted enzyme related to lactoylglutathione lyase